MLDFGECLSVDADNLPSAVYLSLVQTTPPLIYGYFMFVQFGVRQTQIFGCAYLKRK